jgi:hypothetical protein
VALEPVAETQADRHSYGFRRNRCCADATDQLYKVLFGKNAARWVLEGDIKGCFDHISHEWLLRNVITDRRMLRKWLEEGVMIGNVFHDTDEGTPQGGIISPVLANITLDGMDAQLDKYRTRKQDGKTVSRKVNLVRYADDFIITGESREVLEEIKADLILFLRIQHTQVQRRAADKAERESPQEVCKGDARDYILDALAEAGRRDREAEPHDSGVGQLLQIRVVEEGILASRPHHLPTAEEVGDTQTPGQVIGVGT